MRLGLIPDAFNVLDVNIVWTTYKSHKNVQYQRWINGNKLS